MCKWKINNLIIINTNTAGNQSQIIPLHKPLHAQSIPNKAVLIVKYIGDNFIDLTEAWLSFEDFVAEDDVTSMAIYMTKLK